MDYFVPLRFLLELIFVVTILRLEVFDEPALALSVVVRVRSPKPWPLDHQHVHASILAD